jgi:hypothetical protein
MTTSRTQSEEPAVAYSALARAVPERVPGAEQADARGRTMGPPLSPTGPSTPVARRPRRFVRHSTLLLLRPVLRFSPTREAYVLRLVGNRIGPVLRAHRDQLRV